MRRSRRPSQTWGGRPCSGQSPRDLHAVLPLPPPPGLQDPRRECAAKTGRRHCSRRVSTRKEGSTGPSHLQSVCIAQCMHACSLCMQSRTSLTSLPLHAGTPSPRASSGSTSGRCGGRKGVSTCSRAASAKRWSADRAARRIWRRRATAARRPAVHL